MSPRDAVDPGAMPDSHGFDVPGTVIGTACTTNGNAKNIDSRASLNNVNGFFPKLMSAFVRDYHQPNMQHSSLGQAMEGFSVV
ncbi:MAG: hypothetical protein ACTHYN_12935 [Marinobacter sp.]|uniref:hypothetical protein n=1 Tax=Marinobacter sp. TaxID=50741 RepID=UPI003F992104